MRILQLLFRVPYPQNDGGAIAIYNMARGFKDNGVALTLLSYNTKKHYVSKDEIPAELRELGELHTISMDTDVKPLQAFANLFTGESYNVSRFEDENFKQKLIQILREKEFDIIHFDGLYTSLYLDVVREYAPHTKAVLRQHNIEHLIWERMYEGASFPKKQYLHLLSRRLKKYELGVMKKFDAIIPITEVDARQLQEWGIKKTFASSTGLYFEKYTPKQNAGNAPTVFHLGSMDWQPNVEGVKWFVEEVWPLVREKNNEAEFHIAGKSIGRDILRYDKRDAVVVDGEVPDLSGYLNRHAVMVIPLLSGSGMRIKLIEGMALGQAIVSTCIGCEGVKVEDGKHLYVARTAEEFARKLCDLLQAPERRKQFGRASRNLIEQEYDNSLIVGRLLEFYKTLL